MYRNCISFSSSRTRSTVSCVRNRSVALLPLRRSRISITVKAPPLPGCTISRLRTSQSLFWCSRTLPGFKSIALIFMSLGLSKKQRRWECGRLPTSLGTPGKADCATATADLPMADKEAMTAPWWHPDRLAARRDRLVARGRILRATREFFEPAGYVEVETPALQVSPGLEPHL